ncbi:MAG TPA: hypothetical protein VJZ16_04505 [Syntrophales bacterium]|nr:hypothetical protein [Syntrophales bacterium]
MKLQWPKKPEKEQFEISKFISAYADLQNGRSFVVYSKQETPDYFLKDSKTGEIYEIELTSVYLDDRSVPDEHMKPIDGWEEIPDDPTAIENHNLRLIETVKTKVQKARKHYDTSHPLILAVYINEYISIYMEESDWTELVRVNESVFDDIDPFSEIVLWNLANESAMSIIPTPDRKPMKST